MRQPCINMNVFRERRQALGAMMPGAALILPAHPEQIRNHDVHHSYRQDSNFFYLTGFEEPESILLFRPGQSPETILFVRVRDPERETWDGFRYGPEGAVRFFGMEAAYPIADFENLASDLLLHVDKIYYSLFQDRDFDQRMAKVLLKVKQKRKRSGRGLLPIFDSYPLIGEMRVKKSDFELTAMRRACQVSAEAHVAVMRATQPGVHERALHGIFLQEIMSRGAAREGYGSIVASGANSTTLHYVFNDQVLKEGDLLLVDAGAEVDYYTGDITRTYPVSGQFSVTQKKLYERVLELQEQLIRSVRPGLLIQQLQEMTVSGLVDVMLDMGLVKGQKSEVIQTRSYQKYYPHGVSHFLGSDVHDAGRSEFNDQSRSLEPGMVITIEPGLYIPAEDSDAPESLRGLGVRIEDDVAVTEYGQEVLSSAAPKSVDDLESIVGR